MRRLGASADTRMRRSMSSSCQYDEEVELEVGVGAARRSWGVRLADEEELGVRVGVARRSYRSGRHGAR